MNELVIPWGIGAAGEMNHDEEWELGEVSLRVLGYKSDGATIGEVVVYYRNADKNEAWGVDVEVSEDDVVNLIFQLQELLTEARTDA